MTRPASRMSEILDNGPRMTTMYFKLTLTSVRFIAGTAGISLFWRRNMNNGFSRKSTAPTMIDAPSQSLFSFLAKALFCFLAVISPISIAPRTPTWWLVTWDSFRNASPAPLCDSLKWICLHWIVLTNCSRLDSGIYPRLVAMSPMVSVKQFIIRWQFHFKNMKTYWQFVEEYQNYFQMNKFHWQSYVEGMWWICLRNLQREESTNDHHRHRQFLHTWHILQFQPIDQPRVLEAQQTLDLDVPTFGKASEVVSKHQAMAMELLRQN